MPTTLNDLERQVRERLKELEPLVSEAEQLETVLASFESARGERRETAAPRQGARAKPQRTRRIRGEGRSTAGRRGRPAGSATGNRAAEALRLVGERPGITVSELADEMGIGTTYLYRVMPSLERDGKVHKSGTGYLPA